MNPRTTRHGSLTLAAVTALAMACPQAADAYTSRNDHFYCGFDDQEEYANWTWIDANGPDSNNNNTAWWESAGYVIFSPGVQKPCDEWLISPLMRVSGTKELALKIWMRSADYSTLAVTLSPTSGADATVEAQTVTVLPQTNYDKGWYYLSLPLPADLAAGQYRVALHCTNGDWCKALEVYSFEMVEKADVTLSGRATDSASGAALEGVEVTLSGSFLEPQTRTTASDGTYSFSSLPKSAYTLAGALKGYEAATANVTVTTADPVTLDLPMVRKTSAQISGRMVDAQGQPLSRVNITLRNTNGSSTQTARTAEDGAFAFPSLVMGDSYTFQAVRDWKQTVSRTVSLEDGDVEMGDLQMASLVAAPLSITADPVTSGALVSWMMPRRQKDVQYDNDTFRGVYEQRRAGGECMVGIVVPGPVALTQASWVLTEDRDQKQPVNLYVYAKNAAGGYTDDLLYYAADVPNVDYDYSKTPDGKRAITWSTYDFPQPIDAPYGCVVMVGCQNRIDICMSTSENHANVARNDLGMAIFTPENYAFYFRAKGLETASDNAQRAAAMRVAAMGQEDFRCVDPQGVRAQAPAAVDPLAPTYAVWRLTDADSRTDASGWTALADGITDMAWLDRTFLKVPNGAYTYAVQATWPDGQTSDYGFAPAGIEKGTTADQRIYVQTNTAIPFSAGATVQIAAADGSVTLDAVISDADTPAVFPDLRKGQYTVTVARQGFATISQVENLSGADITYILILDEAAPFNIQATQPAESTDVTLTWNQPMGVSEDFDGEDMEDFEVNPVGAAGWAYVDADGAATYGIGACQNTPYPHMFQPMAFMAFCPSACDPAQTDYVVPRSGRRVLAAFGLQNGQANDDWLISPTVEFAQPFTLRFWAASGYFANMGREEFMVGYTTAATPQEVTADNVVWLTDKPATVSALWTPFTYTLPAAARHAIIRCVSNQHFVLALDDVFVGVEESPATAMSSFDVEVDGEKVANTTSRSLTLTGLEVGRHVAKIQTIYMMSDGSRTYSPATSQRFTVEERADIPGLQDGSNGAGMTISLQGRTLRVQGPAAASAVAVYDAVGQQVASAAGDVRTMDLSALTGGVYVVRATAAAEGTPAVTAKIRL